MAKLTDDKAQLHKAIEYAAVKHREQMRKGSDIPYIVHPFEVAQILTAQGADGHVVIAGLLHDVIEDAGVTTEEILEEFGGAVAKIVNAETEDKTKSWEQRKQATIDHLRNGDDFEVMMVACADKLSNLRSIAFDIDRGIEVWGRFRRGKDKQAWYYGEMIDALSPLEDYDMYRELKGLFDKVF